MTPADIKLDSRLSWHRWSALHRLPKQPTFTVCTIVDGEYELQQFRGNDCIISPTFPELRLAVNQIFNPGE